MSKALIDLSRANAPRNTVAEGAEKQNEVPAEPVPEEKAVRKAKSANANAAQAPALAVVANIPAIQPEGSERLSTIGARIPESLHRTIKVFCYSNRLEMQQFVQDALSKHLAELQSGKS